MASSKDNEYNFKDIVIITALTVLAIAGLPLLALLGIFAQFAFVIIAPTVLVGGIVYALATRAEPVIALIHGIEVPSDVFFWRGHSWARKAAKRCVVTGIDDFAQRLLGPVEGITTVPVGQRVEAGEPLATLWRGGRKLPVFAPAPGVVTKVNPVLAAEPLAVNNSPYGRGWLVEMEPERRAFKGLRRGSRALGWMREEVDRLVTMLQPAPAMVSLPDGGELMPDVSSAMDDETWQRVVLEFFEPETQSTVH